MMLAFSEGDRVRAVAALIENRPVMLLAPYRHNGINLAQQLYTEYDAVAPLSAEELGEVEATYALTGGLKVPNGRPFRAPHHTVRLEALVPSVLTRNVKHPTEWQLAEHGVLLLDEIGEFRLPVIEAIVNRYRKFGYGPSIVSIHTRCPCGRGPSAGCHCPEEWTRRWHERVKPLRDISIVIELRARP